MGWGWKVCIVCVVGFLVGHSIFHSLDDFIDVRLGRGSPHIHINPLETSFPQSSSNVTIHSSPFESSTIDGTTSSHPISGSDSIHSRSARIRAFRAFQRAPSNEKVRIRNEQKMRAGEETSWTAVHLFSAEEVKSLFEDITEGLGFLVCIKWTHLLFLTPW
jgi:hypothetical protein